MRSAASDPAWAKFYNMNTRISIQLNVGQITAKEARRKLAAAKCQAYYEQEKR